MGMGEGGVMFMFMLSSSIHAHYIARLGMGRWGDVNVHVNLKHTRALRCRVGYGGWGDVNVHANFTHRCTLH